MQNNGDVHKHCFHSLAEQISELIDRGAQIVLVASGAIAMGRSVLPENNEGVSTLARQVLAAVGQGPLMAEFARSFSEFGIDIAQALLSRGSLNQRDGYLNARNTLLELMQRNIVTIVNENDVVATEELQFGDNDRLAALVANLVDADLLVMLTDVDGYLSPDDQGQLQVVPIVNHVSPDMLRWAGGAGSETGTGGMRTKLEAAGLAMSHGTKVVIGPGQVENSLMRIVAGDPIGTTFLPTGDRRESRKRWMLTDLSLKGQIIVDAGAARALRTDGRSLLPAGIIGHEGKFGRGDLVAVLSPDGITIGHGLSNYTAGDIEQIAGSDSREIQEILGHEYGAEVIHRNNFAIVGTSAAS
jgi:glutamate 5-kinase